MSLTAALALPAPHARRRETDPKAAGSAARHACGRLTGEYVERFWRCRARSLAQPHQIVHHEDGSFSIPTLPMAPAPTDAKPRRNAKRIAKVQRLFEEHHSIEEIALWTGLTRKTVKKYLSAPSEDGSTMRSKTPSTTSNGSTPTLHLPPVWNTPRKRSLGDKIVRLSRSGLGAMAVADRLGKSDEIVRRYLREAKEAGLLAESA